MARVAEAPDVTDAEQLAAPAPRERMPWTVWLLAPVVPVLAFLLYGSSGRDDAYITYWEAGELIRTGRLVNYNGEHVEQSSSLLQTLVLAFIGFVTRVPIPTIGPWVAVLAGALCVPAAYWLAMQIAPRGRWIAALLVATLPPIVYWTVGGLETTLAALFVLLACASVITAAEGRGSLVVAGLCLLGALLVRPETGPVLIGAFAVAGAASWWCAPADWRSDRGFERRAGARRLWMAAAALTAAFVVLASLRRLYFGEWFPRPVSMKASDARVEQGLGYAFGTLVQSRVWLAVVAGVVIIGLTRLRRLTPAWLVAGAVVGAGTVSVVVPGGDWMECGRLLVPWLAVTAVLVGVSVGQLATKARVALVVVLVGASLAGLVNYAATYSTGAAAWSHIMWTGSAAPRPRFDAAYSPGWWERRNAVHARDAAFIAGAAPVMAAVQRVVAPRRVTYASSQAGMVVYYLQDLARDNGERFDFIDIDGLTDDTYDRCRDGVKSNERGTPVPIVRIVHGECGPLPDVISAVNKKMQFASVRRYYTMMYWQGGRLVRSHSPRGEVLSGGQWIAVRNDIAAQVRAELEQ
jgi:hypothetical protein